MMLGREQPQQAELTGVVRRVEWEDEKLIVIHIDKDEAHYWTRIDEGTRVRILPEPLL
jgi:hypothetical protein